MEKIRDQILNTKKYLMYAVCMQPIFFIVDLGSIPFYFFAAWMMVVLLADAKNMIREYFDKHLWFSVFIGAMLISCVLNRDVITGDSLFKVFQCFYIYYILFVGCRDREENKIVVFNIIKFATIMFFVYSIINAIDFGFGFNWFAQDLEYSRLSGIYGNPNNMVICASWGVFGGLLFKNKGFQIFNALLQLSMLYISDCRSMLLGMVLVCVGLLLSFVYNHSSKKVFVFSLAASFLATLGAACFIIFRRFRDWNGFKELIVNGSERILNIITANRYYIWKQSFEILKHYPLFGIAPSTRMARAKQVLSQEMLDLVRPYELNHQLFMDVAMAGGLVGLTAFVIWLLKQVSILWKNRVQFNDKESLIVLCLVCLVFVNSMLDVSIIFDSRVFTMFFWLGLGYLVNNDYNVQKCSNHEPIWSNKIYRHKLC